MCTTCERAKRLPRTEALKVVAQGMALRGYPKCLDKLVGELVGEPEPEVDRDAERAWESRRRGGG